MCMYIKKINAVDGYTCIRNRGENRLKEFSDWFQVLHVKETK